MAVAAAGAQGTDAQQLLCPWPSSHQSYQCLYEGDLLTTPSLK